MAKGRKMQKKVQTCFLPSCVIGGVTDHIQNRNLLNTLCNDDDYGHNGIENGNIIKDLAAMVLVVEEDMEVEDMEVEDMVVVMVIKDLYNYLKS